MIGSRALYPGSRNGQFSVKSPSAFNCTSAVEWTLQHDYRLPHVPASSNLERAHHALEAV